MNKILSEQISILGQRIGVINRTIQSIKEQNTYVYGLAQCWRSIWKDKWYTCQGCISKASQELPKCCSLSHGAIILIMGCLVKYSDINFFGISDTYNGFYVVSTNFNDDPIWIRYKIGTLFTWLGLKVIGGSLYFLWELLRSIWILPILIR